MVLLTRCNKKGQSLIELLVALGLSAVLLPALLTALVSTREGRVQQNQRLQAMTIAKEAEEAVRVVREKDWNTFAANGTYHPVISDSTWQLGSGAVTVGGFTRAVVIADVLRDATGAIVATGGAPDPSTKKVTITVSWSSLYPSSVTTTLYLARFNNLSWIQTTASDFNAGTNTNTVVTNTWDGEVTLGAGGHGNWCAPASAVKSTLDLPGQGVTTAISATPSATTGQPVHAYTTTGNNASGDTLDGVMISDPPYPTPAAPSILATYNSNKAYAVFAGANNTFIGSDHPGLTVIILNPTTLAQVGFFSDSGNERPGTSIAVSGSTGYVTAGSKLYAFDAGMIKGSSSQTELWNVTLAGGGGRVMVVGNYAYVATSSTTSQLQIINLQTRGITSFNVGNGAPATDIFVDSTATYAYLVTSYVAGQSDFFIIDVTTPTSPKIVGSYNTNGMNPKGVVAVPGNRAIVVGSGGLMYQVLNTLDKTNPVSCVTGGGFNPTGVTSINAISAVQEVDGDVYSYILTDNANAEFQVIEGGPGGQFAPNGTFESQTFDATRSAAFNYLLVNGVIPNGTALKYQVAAADAVNGSCTGATFSFIGPDGTASTYFATSSAIPLSTGPGYKNPAQCFRFRAYLSTDNSVYSPVFEEGTINYSP